MQSFVRFLIVFLATVNAFQPTVVKFHYKSSALFATPPPPPVWELSNDFRTFLNQCSIQSFMFLLRQLRDMQTVFWIESFTKPVTGVSSAASDTTMDDADFNTGALDSPTILPDNNNNNNNNIDKPKSKLLQYHGLSAINMTLFPTWDSYFKTLLLQEKETWTIASTKSYAPSYEWEINPPSLCARLISVREQIANEFANDLLVIEQMGQSTMDAYWDAIKQQQQQQQQQTNENTAIMTHRPNLLFLEYDPNFNSDVAPSPLRKGNFDLLYLLTTQEAIHRVLNDPQRQEGAPLISNLFLQGFYQDRTQYFTGSQRYGRADDILQELLAETPRIITVTQGVTSLIDPIRITGLILSQREQVAKEWRELAQTSPREHFTVRKMMLNKMMGLDICPEDFQ